MRARSIRPASWGIVLPVTVVIAFAVAPVHAATTRSEGPKWGDIDSVNAGPGLTGGATQGDATLAVLFGGNGSANTVAHSDHNHNGVYLPADANFDDRYLPLGANFDDRYALLGHDHDSRYSSINHDHDDRYSQLGHDHDDRYLPVGANFDDRYAMLGHDHDDRYLGLGGGTLSGFLSLAVGDLTLLGPNAKVIAPQLVSNAPDGTAPLQVDSGTVVTNLNADKLDGYDASDFAPAGASGVPPHSHPEYAALAGSNAFSGVNVFNGGTTFAGPLTQSTGGASFTWQPFFTSASSYSLRLTDTGKAATRLVVNQDGRVGIGTTSPGFALHVVGDVRATTLNLGTGILSPFMYDMNSSSDRTFQFTNSNGGVANLDVEGNVSAAGFNVATGGSAARAGSSAIASGDTAKSVSTSAVGANSLVFVTPDATGSGCAPVTGPLYVSGRSAGSSFTITVAGAAPGAGQSYCFSWWIVN